MAVRYDKLNEKRAAQAQQKTASIFPKLGNKFEGNLDPNTSEGLYNLAMQQGGRAGEVISELAHPEKSILSSVTQRIRNFGQGIIDVIETPNEIVAGVIETMKGNGMSLSENVMKAIKDDISTSDSLLGEFNSRGKSGLQKAGNFVLRTGIDILLDPLTYVTFGGARGALGLTGGAKVTAGKNVASDLGIEAGKTVSLAQGAGDDLLSYVDEIAKGAKQNPEILKPLKERLGKAGITDDILDGVVKEETDKLLKLMDTDIIDFDVTRKALSNIMEVNPGLAETILDKGGIKFFGKTVLEGQKIRTAANNIPVMKYVDNETKDMRMALGSLFNPNIQGSLRTGFYRIPEEYRMFTKQLNKIKKERGQKFLDRLVVSLDEVGLKTLEEKNTAIRNAFAGAVPSDPVQLAAYKKIHELDGDNWLAMKAAGKNVSYLANRIPRLISRTDAKDTFNAMKHSTLSETINATKKKSNVVFESVTNSGKQVMGDDGSIKLMSGEDVIAKGIDPQVVQQAVAKQADTLATKIDEIASLDLPNGRQLIDEIFKQKKAIESGKLDSVFLDEATGEVFTRRAATLNETLQMPGFSLDEKDINFLESFSQASMQTINQTASTQFVRDIARFGVVSDEAASNFRGLDIDKNITDDLGRDIFFDEEVAENLEKMVSMMQKPTIDTNAFLAAYDSVLSIWKSSVTSMFPSFHARNGVSNVLLNFADIGYHAFNPKTFATSTGLMQNNKKYNKLMDDILKAEAKGADNLPALKGELDQLLSKPVFKDARGHNWTFGELQDVVKKKDIAFTEIATAVKRDEVLSKKKTLTESLEKQEKSKIKEGVRKIFPVYKDFYGYEVGREVGNAIENHGRLVNFLTNLEKTGDVSLAASRTKQFLFDYSDLTDFEKGVMRRIIPFYSFTRFNLEAQAKVLMETPGKAAAQLTTMDTFTDVFSNDDLTEEQKEKLPSWMKRGFYYLKKQEDGTLKSISVTESPFEQPFSAFSTKGILGSISPLIRMPIEQMTGYDMYQGKVFSDATNASGYKFAPKFIKDYIGYDEVSWTDDEGKTNTWSVSLRPSRMNLLNNTPLTARVTSSLRQLTDADNSKKQKATQFLLGTYYQDVDIEKVLKYEEKETLKNYTDVMDTAGILYQFKRNIISKDE